MESRRQRPVATTYNVLFVCTGNTCRSPMAEALARQQVERRGWKHVAVRSAGVAAEPGAPATQQASEVIRELGLDLSSHQATLLTPDLVGWADLILVMSPSHLAVVEDLGGGHKVALLGDFVAGEEGGGVPVPAPFGGSVATYRTTLVELERLIRAAVDRLTAIIEP